MSGSPIQKFSQAAIGSPKTKFNDRNSEDSKFFENQNLKYHIG